MQVLIFLLAMLPVSQKSSVRGDSPKSLLALHENFESYEHFPIPRWTTNNEKVDNDSDTVSIYYPIAQSGNHYCHFGSFYTDSASEWLITPSLLVTDATDTFSFRYRADQYSYPEKIEICVASPPSTNISDFGTVLDTVMYYDTTWAYYTKVLSSFLNQNISIAIHYISNYEYGLRVDDITGPLVDTIGPSVKMLYPHSHFLSSGQSRDTLKFLITDESGVDTAYMMWWTKLPGQGWSSQPNKEFQQSGDTFYTVIGNLTDSMSIMLIVDAYDVIGNFSDPIFKYNILPTYKWLVIYSNNRGRNDMAITNALRDLDPNLVQPDTVSEKEFAELPQNLVDSMYKCMIYSGIFLAPPTDTLIRNFLNYGVVDSGSDRKHLIVFGDDIGWYAHGYGTESNLFAPYLKARYIQDDASSSADSDTIQWTGFNREKFTITSPWPDYVVPFSPDSVISSATDTGTTYVYVNPSSIFLLDLSGDYPQTPGGLYVNELCYIAHYMPFQSVDIDSQQDADTLISRLINWPDSNNMPFVVDSGKLIGPDSITVAADSQTDTIYGTAVASEYNQVLIAYPGIIAQVGWGPDGSLPWEGGWHWFHASIIAQQHWREGNNIYFTRDTFAGVMTAPSAPGHYDYCYRFAAILHGDSTPPGPWIYADLDGTNNRHQKLYSYGYDPAEAGDMKVLCDYDIQVDSVEVIGRHWIGDTDTVFVYYTNTGAYKDTFSVFAGENNYVEDSASKLHVASGSGGISKLHVKYTTEGNDAVKGFVRFYRDQDASNDTAMKVIWVYPVGIYYVQAFSGTWPPSGWTVDNESSYGWEQARDSISGDPAQFDGIFARFDSWYAASGDTGVMISPYIKMWKEVNIKYYFYYINKDGSDSILVYHSLNSGTYLLDTVLKASSDWNKYYIDIPSLKGGIDSLSLKFIGVSDYGFTNPGVDSVVILDAGQINVKEKQDNGHFVFSLSKPYPNPSRGGFNIKFTVPTKEHITLHIYDTEGRLIAVPVSGTFEKGAHAVKWNGKNKNDEKAHQGIYFIELKSNKRSIIKKGILIK